MPESLNKHAIDFVNQICVWNRKQIDKLISQIQIRNCYKVKSNKSFFPKKICSLLHDKVVLIVNGQKKRNALRMN
jgi:hypothetical protein